MGKEKIVMLRFLKSKKERCLYQKSIFSCNRDGLMIQGTEYRPKGENLPVAIICHGFMAFQDTVRQYAKLLARMGYCAYCFDFCGGSVLHFGKSNGKTTEMSVLSEIKDLEAVIRYIHALPYVGNDLLLMGCSQGGLVAALTAAKHPETVSRLVLFYPALCIPDDARAGKMMFARFDPQNIPNEFRCGPMKLGRCYADDVIRMDPFHEIKSYQGPVLIVHGTNDKIVKGSYSIRASEEYSHAELYWIQGGAHGFRKKHDKEAMKVLVQFAQMESSSVIILSS